MRRFGSNGIWLEDGRFVEADVVVLATSSKSGLGRLQLTKDGVPFTFNPEEFMLHQFSAPSFPVLGFHMCSLMTKFYYLKSVYIV